MVIKNNQAAQGSRTIFGTDSTQQQFNFEDSGSVAVPGAVRSSIWQATLSDVATRNLAFVLQTIQSKSEAPMLLCRLLRKISQNLSYLRAVSRQWSRHTEAPSMTE
jgi:hypothetical protein